MAKKTNPLYKGLYELTVFVDSRGNRVSMRANHFCFPVEQCREYFIVPVAYDEDGFVEELFIHEANSSTEVDGLIFSDTNRRDFAFMFNCSEDAILQYVHEIEIIQDKKGETWKQFIGRVKQQHNNA